MNKGWISVHRSLLDHPFWGAEKFTKAQAWLDLMLNANHKENRVMIKGRLVTVKRGEQIRSKVTLAKTWKWNERTVTKFLELLKSEGMIEVESTELTTHVSICNYDAFQNDAIKSTEDSTEQGTQQTTEALQSTVQTNNNNNNVNNENNVNKKPKANKGCRLSQDSLPKDWEEFCLSERPDLTPQSVFDGFRDYWIGVPGAKGVKLDWSATWRNWVRRQNAASKHIKSAGQANRRENIMAFVHGDDKLDEKVIEGESYERK